MPKRWWNRARDEEDDSLEPQESEGDFSADGDVAELEGQEGSPSLESAPAPTAEGDGETGDKDEPRSNEGFGEEEEEGPDSEVESDSEEEETPTFVRARHRPKHKLKSSRKERVAALFSRPPKETSDIDSEGLSGPDGEAVPNEGSEVDEPSRDAAPPERVARPAAASEVADAAPAEQEEPAAPAEQEDPAAVSEPELPIVPAPTRRVGPRRAALQERKSRTRQLKERSLGLSIAAAIVVIGAVAVVANEVSTPDAPTPTATEAPNDGLQTMLLAGTKQRESASSLSWLALVSYDSRTKHGAVVYVPAHTAVEVPGRGLQTLQDSLETGGPQLLLVTTENLLGVGIDRYLELSDRDARLLFENVGPLTVEVPSQVSVSVGGSRTRVLFEVGPQQLSPPRLASFLYTVGVDGDDIELGTRQVSFWTALFEAFGGDPGNLVSALRGAGGVMGESSTAIDQNIALFSSLARLEAPDRSLLPLPVKPLEVHANRLYVAEEEEVSAFMDEFVGEDHGLRNVVKVQVLNGRDDAPGIGQEVASRLINEGFNVILSGNALRLDHRRTLIIVYDPGPDGEALGERTKELLGTGRVQVSTQDQGIVDLTIVVGKDFQRAP
jgi:hypothetical protein